MPGGPTPPVGGLHRIGNKMLAALVAAAVLPAVVVSIYALRRTTDALSMQALTLISEAVASDTRRVEDLLGAVNGELREFVKENSDLKRLLADLMPSTKTRRTGEGHSLADEVWGEIQRDRPRVEQKLRALLSQRGSCKLAWVRSLGFGQADGTAILDLSRDPGAPTATLTRDAGGYLRPVEPPLDEFRDAVLRAWNAAKEEHPERDILCYTLPGAAGEADEVFAARVQAQDGTENGWVFLVHSWRSILQGLGADASVRDSVVASLYNDKLREVATSRTGAWARIPEETFHLADYARAGQPNAALFENGEIVAFALVAPHREAPSDRYVLAFQRPATDLLQSVQRFRIVFTAVLTGALLFAALFGTLLARRLTRPLRVLSEGAAKIGRGDLHQTIDVRTGDEAEELAREFNAMAAQLHALYQGMEETIRERTNQLQQALDELRHVHAQIVESERRYSDIVENASDLIQVTDAEGRIVAANRRQAELFGESADALRGRAFLDWVAADARDVTHRAFAHVLAGNALRAFESALVVGADARRIPIEISATPVLDGGRPAGVRAILRDVSERKEFEARLIKAERLSSVGALAAGVAHEINNPLGIINLFAQRVLERAKKGEIDVDKLDKIVEQGRRVAAITRNLLDFARAAPTRLAPFDVAAVIQSTCALVADRARTSSIELRQEVAAGLPQVVGNGQQIGQVLLNLLLNAFQALGKEGQVTVRAAIVADGRLPTGGRALRVTVEDSGPGVPADVLPKLFEPFFTTKAPGEGTGLGLSVSYGILKEHHGAIFAGNRPEGGARFEFELPLDAATEPVVPMSPAGAPGAS